MGDYSILLVDDDVNIRRTVGKALQSEGYDVVTASNGKEAQEWINERKFDLILTDLVMEPIDGIGVLKTAKEVHPETMVIILTGFGDLRSAIDAIQLDADDYLLKPCESEDLLFRVAACLEKLELIREARSYREALENLNRELENRVEARTAELLKTNQRLKQEIEERKKIEAALIESEHNYRSIFENIIDVYYRLDLEGKLTRVSPSGIKLFGYESVEEILGKNIAAEFYVDHSERKKLEKELLKWGQVKYESRLKRKDGTIIVTETNSHLVYDGTGKPLAVEGIIRDITERVKAENFLRESEERYRTLVETMNDGLVVQDENGVVTYANRRFCEMINRAENDVIGSHLVDFIENKSKRSFKKNFMRKEGDGRESFEVVWVQKNGQKISTLVSPKVIYDDQQKIKCSFAVISDITALKETENALKEREQLLKIKTENLEEVNTALEVLLLKREEDKTDLEDNVMSNVKKLISPYFQKMKKTRLDERQEAYLNIIESNVKEIITPFSRKLTLKNLGLTSAELQIANMIKQGHITKKIAKLRNISPRTVDTHRKNIRKKLGLENKKANLRSYLLALK